MKVRRYYPIRPNGPNRFWDEFFQFPAESNYDKMVPSVNVKETESAYEVELAAPGYERSDFNIEVEKGVMAISVKKEQEISEDKGANYKRREFRATSFKRTFELPEHVNADEVQAKYNNGILSVLLPKSEGVKARVIEVS
jgi:HSP20 family protein